MDVRSSILAGARAAAPILIGIVPFGLMYGVVAVGQGFDRITALLMSPIVFAGASQIVVAELWGKGAPVAVIVATGLVVNLRFMMYSASLAPHLRDARSWQRALGAYLLTDQAFAVSVIRFQERDDVHRFAFYFGAAISFWATWQTSSAVGVLLGMQVPPAWGLEFSVPLMFLALLIPTLRASTPALVAIVSGVAAIILHDLPFHLGLVAAASIGLLIGAVRERWG